MASEIVATCVDSRMEAVLPEILPRLGVKTGDYHRVTAFGGSLGLDHEFELCELVVDNLHPHRINVFDHMDCKAFRKKFGQDMDLKSERERHLELLHQIEGRLRKEYPGLDEVRLFLLPDTTPEKINPTILEVSNKGVVEVS